MSASSQSDEPSRRRRWYFYLLWLLGAVAVIAIGLWAFRLFTLRPLRETAVQELVDAVRQEDEQRIPAATGKVKLLRADREAAEDLVPLLDDGKWSICLTAAGALGDLGDEAIPALVGSVEGKTAAGSVRDHDLVLWARSSRHPRAVTHLCDILGSHADGAVRRTLIETLATRCPPEEDEKWRVVFADVKGDAQAASGSAGKLGVFGPAAAGVQESLCLALADADPSVRAAAAEALARFRPGDAAVWIALKRAAADEDVSVRANAAYALAMIDSRRAAFALPTALAALSGADAGNRLNAAHAISAIDPARFPEVWPALKALLLSLQDDEPGLRRPVLAIWSFGAHATPAVPELIRIVRKRKSDFGLAVRALTAIGVAANDGRVEDFLVAQVEYADWHRRTLWDLVGFARNGSQRSLAALTAALAHNDPFTRGTAATCLGLVGPPAQAALPALQRVLRDDQEEMVRRGAAEAIRKIDPQAGAGAGQGGASPPR